MFEGDIMRITTADVLLLEDNMPHLILSGSTNYPKVKNFLQVKDVVQVMTDMFFMDRQIAEQVYLIAMDIKCKPIYFFLLNKGTINTSLVDVRGLMARMLLCNTASFIVVHNHVSGEITPSKEDEKVTENISRAAKIMGLTFCDHIIIGQNGRYYSFRENRKDLFDI